MSLKKDNFETLAGHLQKSSRHCYWVKLSLSESTFHSHAPIHMPKIEVQRITCPDPLGITPESWF